MKRHLPPLGLALACLLPAGPASGQVQEVVRLYGRILDATTGEPVYGASILRGEGGAGHVTDTLGLWTLEVPEADEYLITAGQLGYRMALVTLPATAPREFTTILLEPDPVELEGLRVLVDRFSERRRFYQETIRVLDQARLLQAPAISAWQVVQANVPQAQQCPDAPMSICALRRGRVQPIRVCVDEERTWGGAQDLERFFASDLYMVEVMNMGQEVRIYTRRFVAQMIELRKNLEPLFWACGGGM